jgi:hypothetical protein
MGSKLEVGPALDVGTGKGADYRRGEGGPGSLPRRGNHGAPGRSSDRHPVAALSAVAPGDPHGSAESATVARLYRVLPHIDFSRDVLEGCESSLRGMSVAPCGRTDLGTPARLAGEGAPPPKKNP